MSGQRETEAHRLVLEGMGSWRGPDPNNVAPSPTGARRLQGSTRRAATGIAYARGHSLSGSGLDYKGAAKKKAADMSWRSTAWKQALEEPRRNPGCSS